MGVVVVVVVVVVVAVVEYTVYSTRVGESGRAVDAVGELTLARRGDAAAGPLTLLSRICRCSGVSDMLCKLTSQWLYSIDVGRQKISPRRTLQLCTLAADVTASGCRIRALWLRCLQHTS